MVTYADIARKMGISKASVSVALRNQRGVSEELRARILETARKMGYRPNPLVSAHMAYLRGTKSAQYKGKLAFLSSAGDQAATEKHERDSLYWRGAQETAHKLGFDVEVFSLVDPDLPPDRIGRMLWARGVPGVIIGPIVNPGQLDFDVTPFAAVTLGFSLRKPRLHCVRPNAYDMMLSLLNILENRGYQRPGFAQTLDEDKWSCHLWGASYQAWCTTRKQSTKTPPMLLAHRSDKDAFFKWYEKHRPDVLISNAHTFPQWLKDAGIRMPEDVGYASLLCLPDVHDYSGLHPDLKGIGSAAVQLLTSQIYNCETGEPNSPQQLLLPAIWNEGVTLNPPPDEEDISSFLFFPS